ncbi:MAG: H-type small acid-soluble spore protein [Alicyclobacillus sp.]|nr:H-type small acid-soluble spore protein [Alicyclobacillus sp.]
MEEATTMDIQRAKEILESPHIIPVTYRGKPIHIDQVFETNQYVEGHYEDGTTVNAPAAELMEGSTPAQS